MPEKSILIGNGPNRVDTGNSSWQGVLERLADFSGQTAVLQGHASKPFSLLFEEIALRSARRGISEAELKDKVAEWLAALQPNNIHSAMMNIGARHVLTTNYDYSLELATGHTANCVDLSAETRYSLFRCREAGPSRVWHLHGEIEKPATITLGHDQYVGYLYKARNYLSNENIRRRTGPSDYRSPVIHRRYRFEEYAEPYSWIDIFLRDNIHIAGFSFAYGEVALWWLLGYKERLRLQDDRMAKGIEVGNTWFYYFEEDTRSEAARAHLDVLHGLGVRLVPILLGGDYRAGWSRVVTAIARAT